MKLDKPLKKEIWKDIPGYEGYYKASSLGNIKSLKRTVPNGTRNMLLKERILNPSPDSNGYLKSELFKNGNGKHLRIHQLIAMSFLDHVVNGRKIIIDHINNVKTDNRAKNLQITTQRINITKDRPKGTSEYTGVSWGKACNKWVSRISLDGIEKYLGVFTDEKAASDAYQSALKLYKKLNKK